MYCKTLLGTGIAALLVAVPAFSAEQSDSDWNKLYKEAVDLRAKGDLYASIDKFNALLAANPGLRRARLELAIAYYRTARYTEARNHAEKVLAEKDVPNDVRETVRFFLSQVQTQEEAQRQKSRALNGSVTVGIGHDTNVNAGPSSNVIDIDGTSLNLVDGSKPQTDFYHTLGASVGHTYVVPGSVNVSGRAADLLWQSAASINRREYQDEHPYTTDVVSVSTGPALISHDNWRAKLDMQEDYVRLGDNALALYSSLNPSYTIMNRGDEYTVRGQWQYREFMTNENQDREGQRYAVGLDYVHRLSNDIALTAGADIYKQEAKVEEQENNAYDAYIGAFWHVWTDTSAYGRVTYRVTDYLGREALFDEGRIERQPSYVLGVNHAFVGGAMDGYGIGARLSYTDNHSNLDIYNYDRTDVSVNVTKKF